MSDRYTQLVNNPIGRIIAGQVGLPRPVELERYEPGQPVISGTALLGAAPGSRLQEAVAGVLRGIRADVATPEDDDGGPLKALVFDATGIVASEDLVEAQAFFGPAIRRVQESGRVLLLGTAPTDCASPREATAQRALEGLVRSIGKEVGRGATANLVYVAPGAEAAIESTLRFLLSPKSAYVSAQVVRVGAPVAAPHAVGWEAPLSGKVALVTGASRGIGEAIATVLARDGAHIVGVDVPAMTDELAAVTARVGGTSLMLDITDDDAPATIAQQLLDQHGGVDVVVHNAGVTRDKRLGGMPADRWEMVLQINLTSEELINQELLARSVIRDNGRIVCVSSISGIAGNAGQTNYSTSKAGVIGMVQSLAPVLAERGATINAVAPGFIETQMTARVPIAIREAGRRMNSLAQGGLPVDVAETIAWFASPGSAGINGNVVRVCGQSLLGA